MRAVVASIYNSTMSVYRCSRADRAAFSIIGSSLNTRSFTSWYDCLTVSDRSALIL